LVRNVYEHLVRVVFEHADGSREAHEAPAGQSIMDCAVDHAVRGIRGQCGGGCTCGTCHCWIDAGWRGRVPPPGADELELLDYLPDRRDESRLACRVVLEPALDGIVVVIPPEPRPVNE
jgi:2Fe-2S ferredoxin